MENQPGIIMRALATRQGKRVASAPIDDLFGDHPLAHRRIDRDVLTPPQGRQLRPFRRTAAI